MAPESQGLFASDFPEASAEVFDGWLMGLEYPFTDSESVLGAAPLHLEGLAPVAKYISGEWSAL